MCCVGLLSVSGSYTALEHVHVLVQHTALSHQELFGLCLSLLPTVLTPGYYAQELAPDGTIKAAALCPWGYFCPGGTPVASFSVRDSTALLTTEPTIKRCPFNAWTIDLGATSGDACSECTHVAAAAARCPLAGPTRQC